MESPLNAFTMNFIQSLFVEKMPELPEVNEVPVICVPSQLIDSWLVNIPET
jgi:gamma-glutamyl hydrolase